MSSKDIYLDLISSPVRALTLRIFCISQDYNLTFEGSKLTFQTQDTLDINLIYFWSVLFSSGPGAKNNDRSILIKAKF